MNGEIPSGMQARVADIEPSALSDAARLALSQVMVNRPDLLHRSDAERWLERTVAILAHNIDSGRLQRAPLDAAPAPSVLSDYAARVLAGQLAEGERVEAFRAGDAPTWTAIIEQMEQRAYHRLGPSGRHEWAAAEARDLAARTCGDLWQWLQAHPFPFDVPFDRWLARGLDNRLRHSGRMRTARQRHTAGSLDQPISSDGTTRADLIQVDCIAAWLEQETRRELIAGALARLDERRARVVRLWYLEGWPADEIAAEMGVEVDYVYTLRGRAVRRLRRLLTKAAVS